MSLRTLLARGSARRRTTWYRDYVETMVEPDAPGAVALRTASTLELQVRAGVSV